MVLELWHTYAAPRRADQEVRLVVVSHGSPTAKLVLAALGLAIAPGIGVQLRIDNASISTVEYFPPSRLLLGLNRVEHLEPLRVDGRPVDPATPDTPERSSCAPLLADRART